jgi:hypothetical protein
MAQRLSASRLVGGSSNCRSGLSFSDRIPPLRLYFGVSGDELEGYNLYGFETVYRARCHLEGQPEDRHGRLQRDLACSLHPQGPLAGIVMWRHAVLKIAEPHLWPAADVASKTSETSSNARIFIKSRTRRRSPIDVGLVRVGEVDRISSRSARPGTRANIDEFTQAIGRRTRETALAV